jgi:hypothetical protein
MTGGKSYHFENPHHQLDDLLATLRYQLPGIAVDGRVLLSGDCRFPKGRPGRLLLLEEMAGQGKRIDQAVVPVLDQAWQKLLAQPTAAASEDDPAYAVSYGRLWSALLLILMACSWLGWHLT